MSHYEARLERDLAIIRQKLTAMSVMVEQSVKDAVYALIEGDNKLAYETIIRDNPVNRSNEEITKHCYAFIARHLPSAGHLRRISSIIRTCVDLERIGDMSVSICRQAVQLSAPLDKTMTRNVEALGDEVRHMLHQALTAFNEENEELARSTAQLAGQSNKTFKAAFEDLATEDNKERWSVKDLLSLLSIFYSLERVGDQSKNICEEAVFVVSGQTKQRKAVKILFLEEENNYLSLMAEAAGKKICPECGSYSSAGTKPAKELAPDFIAFMGRTGTDFITNKPKFFDNTRLDDYKVLISLQGPIKSYLEVVPFDCIVLEWDVGPVLAEIPTDQRQNQFEDTYRDLSHKISNLLALMRGEEGL